MCCSRLQVICWYCSDLLNYASNELCRQNTYLLVKIFFDARNFSSLATFCQYANWSDRRFCACVSWHLLAAWKSLLHATMFSCASLKFDRASCIKQRKTMSLPDKQLVTQNCLDYAHKCSAGAWVMVLGKCHTAATTTEWTAAEQPIDSAHNLLMQNCWHTQQYIEVFSS